MPNTCKRQLTVRRIVTWGDRVPAGIVYTPRVLDYVCETIDAWLRKELKASWWHVNSSAVRVCQQSTPFAISSAF